MKLKLRKIGNSLGVLIPKGVITNCREGNEKEMEVITENRNLCPLCGEGSAGDELCKWCAKKVEHQIGEKKEEKVIISKARVNLELCKKHPGSFKDTCECK